MQKLKRFSSLLVVLIVMIFAVGALGCGSSKSVHIYDNAKIVDQMNGVGNKKIGDISVIEMNSTDITQEKLEDWYFNYASKHVGDKAEGDRYAYCLILYKDKPGTGIAYNGLLSKDVPITRDKTGYSIGAGGQALVPTEDKHLKELK